jgi:cytochrome c
MLKAFTFVFAFSFIACHSSSKLNNETYTVSGGELERIGSGFIKSNDCLTCHSYDQRLVGPSFQAISEKYNETSVDMLSRKIIKGGNGNWGQIPMIPHPKLSKNDADMIVRYILSLKNK